MNKKWKDQRETYCKCNGHIWILRSDKIISQFTQELWIIWVKMQHDRLKKGEI
ncbi:hypothetical protein LCGC14_1748150 [marine sediment metagenome]|uniref:Uncharacterized protein n=1 Tax=marine sediment metagenome TaxID=412755 RepID=A0A0F9HS28_9ZZZZ